MGVESDKLRDLIDNTWPAVVTNSDNTITQLTTQKTELQAQIDAVEWALDQATTDQTARLVAKGHDLEYYGSTYGITTLSDWLLGDLITTTNITYVTDDSFTVDTDMTSTFTAGLKIIVDCGVDGYVVRTVVSSVYTTVTTVNLTNTEDPITVNITDVYEVVYEYLGLGWDSDVDITANINFFVAGYDHLSHSLGTSGTYGLYELLSSIDDGITLHTNNKAAYTSFISLYENYAT